ncbi:MAG TPA: efflux RND transporter permease subunit, partial [Gammaproteobacteria bacterium]|nr:efflux RND transporter permease subunit [Gammaproteobacteria bacterium]
ADADVIAGFITSPLEIAIAQANGIDYMTSSSVNGKSTITANLRLNFDPNKSLTEISTKVASVRNNLPPQSQQSVINVAIGETIDAMYIGFNSKVLPANNITDYLSRAVQPKLQSIEGVQNAELLGAQNFALRAWLNPNKLAAYNLTAADINAALIANNYISGLGNTKGQMVQVNLTANTELHSVDEFKKLIIKEHNGAFVRLEDVATVVMGADNYDSEVSFDGQQAVYIGIKIAPGANLLQVIDRVRTVWPDISNMLPTGIDGKIVYDSTKFVNSAIHEVERTLIEALIIVTFVIFAFLGNFRSVIIPIVAIPLSLVGAFIFMLMLGYSINLLTLLALVLAIGLVVDDAIIVVENVSRHLEDGVKPLDAAIIAARELGNPIIAMTIVLLAVYVPIGFQGGLTGALFSEFAFTLVGAVTISAVVALTLSPMMCSGLLKPHKPGLIDRMFDKIRDKYKKRLHNSLNYKSVTIMLTIIILSSIHYLYSSSSAELAPEEDQGIILAMSTAAPNATLQQRSLYAAQIYKDFDSYPETDHVFQLDEPGFMMGGQVLKPWDERTRTAAQLQPLVQQQLKTITGLQVAVFQPPPLPGSSGLPVQFVIQTTDPFARLNEISQNFLSAAKSSGMFMFVDSDLKYDNPQAMLEIDHDMASQLGLTMTDVGSALSSMLGGGYVNYFSLDGRSYKVIPQVQQRFRLNTDQLQNYYIQTKSGFPVQLSTIIKIVYRTIPRSINHFQQLNSATISGVLVPGVSVGQGLESLRALARDTLPDGYLIDYAGQSRQYIQESSGFLLTFGFAIVVIFLALAAQFESFRDPLIILVSVPMSIAGALIFICLGVGGSTLNIYTQVGLVTLMGLISKHGILIVQFANELQLQGLSKREAIEEAAALRLRPILMTTAAMVLG